jgi:GNAT superfamily N-acetyltransferase
MSPADFAALENVERDAMTDFYGAAPPDFRAAHAVDVRDVGSAACFVCRDLEPAVMFRRALGLGVGREAGEGELDDVLEHMNGCGQRYAVTVAPQSRPAALPAWLAARGFTAGYSWMRFTRACAGTPRAATGLEIRVVDAQLGGAFGRVVTDGYGLGAEVAPWVAALPGRQGWICVMAFADAAPVAAGAAYVSGEHAWLGFGATLPDYRRRGAQSALLARRLDEAAARGASVAATETGERLPDRPSASYRNILRAGFEEAYLRQNHMSPA